MKKIVGRNSIQGWDYGTVGTKTHYKDINGKELYVGDLVQFTSPARGELVIEPIVECDNKQFIMGIEMYCNDKSGRVSVVTDIVKVRDHNDLSVSEALSDGDLEVVEG